MQTDLRETKRVCEKKKLFKCNLFECYSFPKLDLRKRVICVHDELNARSPLSPNLNLKIYISRVHKKNKILKCDLCKLMATVDFSTNQISKYYIGENFKGIVLYP